MSLLEIMVVITLIGLVTAAVGVSVMNSLGDGQSKTARNQAYALEEAVKSYRLLHGRYPSTSEGLTSLVNPSKGKPVLERLPQDPWGKDYEYISPGVNNPRSFDVLSAGPDGVMDSGDEVGNWPAAG